MSDDAANGQNPDDAGDGQNPDDAAGGQNPQDAAEGQSPQDSADGQSPQDNADGQSLQSNADGQDPAPGSVFSLGWLMAQLFGAPQNESEASSSRQSPPRLPTVTELSEDEQMKLAFAELDDLLGARKGLSESVKAAWAAPEHHGYPDAVRALHVANLGQFAEDLKQISAYQLGVALRDMCSLPDQPPGHTPPKQERAQFLQNFDRRRLATVQTWLAQADGALPAKSAATVSRSVQHWQDWADVWASTNASHLDNAWKEERPYVVDALRAQGRSWHALLAGQTDTSGQTSVEAWVEAGESILRSVRMLGVRILRRFWPVVAVILAITGALLYLVSANTQGATTVWASLVTVAGSFGVSGASLRAAAKKSVSGIEADLERAAILDAQAWAVTWLPTLPASAGRLQQSMQQARLRRRGVAAPQARKGLEAAVQP
jgi:hypothetical protein